MEHSITKTHPITGHRSRATVSRVVNFDHLLIATDYSGASFPLLSGGELRGARGVVTGSNRGSNRGFTRLG